MVAGHRSAVLLALSFATALALSGVAVATARPGPVSPSVAVASALTDVRRSVVWYGVPQVAPRTIHIESSSINAPIADEFQITYADDNFTLVYQRSAGGPVTNQYTLTASGFAEWNDSLGEGHPEDWKMVAYTPLGPNAFGRFPIQHSMQITATGVEVNTFVIVSNKGEVELNLTIADGFVRLPTGQYLTPMEAKLSLDIHHNMTRADTRLSLQLGLATDQKVALENQSWDDLNEFSTDDRAVNVTNDAGLESSSAFFAWSNIASVNGQSGEVLPSGPTVNTTTGEYDLYLAYPHPAIPSTQLDISHDPTLGVVSAAYDSIVHPGQGSPLQFGSDAVLYGISLGVIAAFVAASAILVSRRRGKAP